MARELRWWIVGTVLACTGLAFVYLPPRGAAWLGQDSRQRETPSPYRLRERALARRLQTVESELRLFEYREQLRPELDRRRAEGIPTPASLVVGADSLPDTVRRRIAGEVDAVWRRLGLGVTKVAVGVVLEILPASQQAPAMYYLLPDSSDRTSCIALLPARYWRARVQGALGPCAYYAAFGNPGRGIARWLSARNYDLALDPAWGDTSVRRSTPVWLSPILDPEAFWTLAYRLPPSGLGCLASRAEACRTAVLGSGQATDSVRRVITNDLWFWLRRRSLLGDEHYLADVLRAVGHERFREFWNSDLPVDSALTAAVRMPIGQWTRRWERRTAPVVRLGPAAPPQGVLFGLLLALVAVGWVVRTVRWREVR